MIRAEQKPAKINKQIKPLRKKLGSEANLCNFA